jgi:hypothetical protein
VLIRQVFELNLINQIDTIRRLISWNFDEYACAFYFKGASLFGLCMAQGLSFADIIKQFQEGRFCSPNRILIKKKQKRAHM